MVPSETKELLSEILKWQRLQGIMTLREILPELLSEEKKKAVYELTNGKNSQQAISKKAGVATGSVSGWWNTWHSYGILIKNGSRYKKIISLKDLGINVALPEETEKEGKSPKGGA